MEPYELLIRFSDSAQFTAGSVIDLRSASQLAVHPWSFREMQSPGIGGVHARLRVSPGNEAQVRSLVDGDTKIHPVYGIPVPDRDRTRHFDLSIMPSPVVDALFTNGFYDMAGSAFPAAWVQDL